MTVECPLRESEDTEAGSDDRSYCPHPLYSLCIDARAAILGLGCSPNELKPFQLNASVEWRMGMPGSGDEVDVVLMFGGDGTVHRHLGQLVRLGLPILVVPVGSGNDFARALGCGGCGIRCRHGRDFAVGRGMFGQLIWESFLRLTVRVAQLSRLDTSVVWQESGLMARWRRGRTGCRGGCGGMAGTC